MESSHKLRKEGRAELCSNPVLSVTNCVRGQVMKFSYPLFDHLFNKFSIVSHSFIPQVFPKHLLCAGHCSRSWRYSFKHDRPSSFLSEVDLL